MKLGILNNGMAEEESIESTTAQAAIGHGYIIFVESDKLIDTKLDSKLEIFCDVSMRMAS